MATESQNGMPTAKDEEMMMKESPKERKRSSKEKKEKKASKEKKEEAPEKKEEVAEKKEEVVEKKEVAEKKDVADAEMKDASEAPKQEVAKDVEGDASADKRKKVAPKDVFVNPYDSTINVLVSAEGIVSTFHQAGLGSLLAGARGNTGVKSGRYYFEAKVVDVVPNQGRHEVRVGFSTSTADLLGGSGSFLFDLPSGSLHLGETTKPHSKRTRTQDLVGVLLNRDDKSEHNNTISLFINGERATEPQKLPEGLDALYPHVVFKGCYVAINFRSIISQLQFTVRMLADAAQGDVETSAIAAPATQEAIFPVGFETEEYIEQLAAQNPDFVVLTTKTMRAWAAKSGQKTVACCEDGGKHIGSLLRNRKFIVAMSDTLFATERKGLCARFAGYKKTAKVVMGEPKQHVTGFSSVTLPSEEEGFDVIEYITSKEDAETKLEEWKADCKLRSRVDNLKVGTFCKEKMQEFKKLVEEKKKNKDEFPQLTEEDYMLLNLRAEIHYLLHAFQEDVNDELRPGFAAVHLCHYFKLYMMKPLVLAAFGLEQAADLLELIPEVLSMDDKTLLLPKLEKDCSQTLFFDQTESARINRQDHLDAGDENAALKFTARSAMNSMRGKGSKGGKGGNVAPSQPVRPLRAIPSISTMKRIVPQAWEQSGIKRK